jgi:hypothetical protein
MRILTKLAVLGGIAYVGKRLYDSYAAPAAGVGNANLGNRVGFDTPTGTDPAAKYSEPGYQDKSFGQAVEQDQQLVDRLVRDSGGDMNAAESQFREESAGAPVLDRQETQK